MRSFSTRAVGLLILVLGLWGGLAPFVGPYLHFTLGPTKSWTWTSGRLFLDVLPGITAVLGGLMLISAGPRRSARLGALLALAAGIWFAIGPEVSLLWNTAGAEGAAHGSRAVRVFEMLTYHTGLGVLIAALAGYALPRFVPAREVVPESTPAAAEPTAAYAPSAAEPEAAHSSTARAERDRPLTGLAASQGRAEPAATPTGGDRAGAPAEPVGDGRAPEPIERNREPEQVPDRSAGGYSAPTPPSEAPVSTSPAGAAARERERETAVSTPSAQDGEPAPTAPVADQTQQHAGGPYVGRRRRGGLLSPFLRR